MPTEDQISLSSSSVSSEPIPEIKRRKNLQNLYNIVNEIYTSEAHFVSILRLLNVDFRKHIQNELTQQVNNSGNISHNNNNSNSNTNSNDNGDGTQSTSSATIKININLSGGSSSNNYDTQYMNQALECIEKLLKHLPQLQALNENLLDELKRARDEWPKTQKVSHVLVKIGPFLKHYSSYIKDFESVQLQLNEGLKKSTQLNDIIKKFESDERCQKLAIQHHLLTPIQRIPQYRLLLQQYLHHLKPDDQDYEDTVEALEVVSRVAEHANQSMSDGINFAKLLALQAKIVGKQRDIVQPGRVFIKEGELIKISRKQRQPRWFILLNDALLYLTQIQSSDILYLKYELALGDNSHVITPNERVGGDQDDQLMVDQQFETEFCVCTPARSFTLIAKNRRERDDWVQCLRRTIQEHQTKLKSFNSGTHIGSPSNIKQSSLSSSTTSSSTLQHQQSSVDSFKTATSDSLDMSTTTMSCSLNSSGSQQQQPTESTNVNNDSFRPPKPPLLGIQAPLWTPDSRVSMCQLCTSNFSALFRRHHCRCCGRVVCSACSGNKAPLVYLKCRSARVCDQCFESLKANMHLYYLPSNRVQLSNGGKINERELKRLDEHFKSLLKTQFSKHTGFERIKRGLLAAAAAATAGEQQNKPATAEATTSNGLSGGTGEGVGSLQKSSSSSLSLSLSAGNCLDVNQTKTSDKPPTLKRPEKPLICGHLHKRHTKKSKWKRQWFVIRRNNVLEAYRAIDDVAAISCMPLLSYVADRPSEQIDGLDVSCLIRLRHNSLLSNAASLQKSSKVADSKKKIVGLEHWFRAENQQAAERWFEAFLKATQMDNELGDDNKENQRPTTLTTATATIPHSSGSFTCG